MPYAITRLIKFFFFYLCNWLYNLGYPQKKKLGRNGTDWYQEKLKYFYLLIDTQAKEITKVDVLSFAAVFRDVTQRRGSVA